MLTNQEKDTKEREEQRAEGLQLKYRRIKSQVASLNNFDATCLLFYLMGFNSTNPKFVDEVDYWLNDPQYGHAPEVRANREKAKAE